MYDLNVYLVRKDYMKLLKNNLRYIIMFGLSFAPVLSSSEAAADIPYTTFNSIDGGNIDTND